MLRIDPVGLPLRALPTALLLFALAACGDDGGEPAADETAAEAPIDLEGEAVEPPFRVAGDLDGLLLVWFDEEGPHTATRRDDVPAAHREQVRVDSLRIAPEDRLDPSFVYLADLRAERGGRYPVRKVRREAFDALVDRASGAEELLAERDEPAEAVEGEGAGEGTGTPSADADVVIYGADWCGACRSAARYLTSRGVPFVEKNVERDPAALAEMQAKARRAGVTPSGIPVIDFRGTILTGFDPSRIDSLIRGT